MKLDVRETFAMAWRNVWRNPRRTLITASAIGLGLALFVVSFAYIRGFVNYALEATTSAWTGAAQIHAKSYVVSRDAEHVIPDGARVLEQARGLPEVSAAAPRVYAHAVAAMGDRTARVELVGMDLEAERRVTNFHEKLSRGHWPSEEDHALIGVKLADELELGVGDKLVITVADARSGEMNHHLVRLSGLVFTNNVYLDRQAVLVALPTAQRLLGVPGAFHEIALALTVDARREAPIAAALAPLERPDLAVRPWQVVQKTLATVLELNDYVMWISVFVVFLIAAFGIVNTMTMSFLERYREFGILRAVGTSPLRLMGMVLTEAAWLGGLGVAIGLVLGLLAYWPLSVYGLTVGSAEGFGLSFDRTIYFDLDLMATVELSVVFFALTVLTALSTARRAAMVEPVRALRHV